MNDLLTIHISVAVPLRIDEIRRAGGPTDEDFERIKRYPAELGPRGDLLLFPTGTKGAAKELVGDLVDGIAVLAFAAGGVKVFGMHFEAKAGVSYRPTLEPGMILKERSV